jgi:hypothetical protein
MIESFLAARMASTPLILIKTADPAITLKTINSGVERQQESRGKKDVVVPMISWDCINGMVGLNTEGIQSVQKAAGASAKDDIKVATTNYTDALECAARLAPESILFFYNAHAGFDPPNPNYIQAIWLLRDQFKRNRRQLVMLSPGCTLPPEIAQDVYVIDEPLPNQAELGAIISKAFKDVEHEISAEDLAKGVDSICGLASFPAEQVTVMSMKRDEQKNIVLDLDKMWERKRQIVEATPGLSIYRGKEKFDDIGGLNNIKDFLRLFINGRRRPRLVLFMDEIEKMVAGENESSGTSQALLGKFLSYTQQRNERNHVKVNGALLLGHAGVGKSLICKALGNEAGVPTVMWDLGSVKSSLVGSSEARMDQALKIIDAVGNGEIILLASCNKVERLSPEFRSRFQLSTWFFDLPTSEEREKIWALHRKRFEIDPEDPKPDDDGWVGREIESCCQGAYLLNISLKEASKYIAPSITANAEAIENLRRTASGRYLSASYPGPYKHAVSSTMTGASRAIEV